MKPKSRKTQLENRIANQQAKIRTLQQAIGEATAELVEITPDEERERVPARIAVVPQHAVVVVPHEACQSTNQIDDPELIQALAHGQEIKARCLKCGAALLIYKPMVEEAGPGLRVVKS
jgi:hypothetical protein